MCPATHTRLSRGSTDSIESSFQGEERCGALNQTFRFTPAPIFLSLFTPKKKTMKGLPCHSPLNFCSLILLSWGTCLIQKRSSIASLTSRYGWDDVPGAQGLCIPCMMYVKCEPYILCGRHCPCAFGSGLDTWENSRDHRPGGFGCSHCCLCSYLL